MFHWWSKRKEDCNREANRTVSTLSHTPQNDHPVSTPPIGTIDDFTFPSPIDPPVCHNSQRLERSSSFSCFSSSISDLDEELTISDYDTDPDTSRHTDDTLDTSARADSDIDNTVEYFLVTGIGKDIDGENIELAVCHNLWEDGDIVVAVVNTVDPISLGFDPQSRRGKSLLFEINCRFRKKRLIWNLKRSHGDFTQLHTLLSKDFQSALKERKIRLPKGLRKWDRRTVSKDLAATQKLLMKLNLYLHKLFEITSIYHSEALRSFLTLRINSTSMDTEEHFDHELLPLTRAPIRPLIPNFRSSEDYSIQKEAQSTKSVKTTLINESREINVEEKEFTLKSLNSNPAVLANNVDENISDMCKAFGSDSAQIATMYQSVLPLPTVGRQLPHQIPQCNEPILYGSGIQLRVLGGFIIGLTKRSAMAHSHKAVATVAAGVAGVMLTGPLSAVLALGALGGGVGKYQLDKTFYLTVMRPKAFCAPKGWTFESKLSPAKRIRRHSSADKSEFTNGLSSTITNVNKSSDMGCTEVSPCSTAAKRSGKFHFQKRSTRQALSPSKQSTSKRSQRSGFLIESGELYSGPNRKVQFGDYIHLFCRSVKKSVRISIPPNSKRGHLMVTNTNSKTAALRLVSPYGYTGSLHCGSLVYIQVLNGNWAGQYVGVNGEFIATSKSGPTIFKVCVQDHQCHASENMVHVNRPIPRQSFTLRILVYNVWLMPGILTSLNDKLSPNTMQRACAIPLCLDPLSVDVVVFCEAFCNHAREQLIGKMKEMGFGYETKVVGNVSVSSKKAIEGGCFAMSRYPIEKFKEITFGMSVGDDRLSDKGVIYFQIRVNGELVHVFGTHLQAWETKTAVSARKSQLKLIRDFLDSMRLDAADAVFIVGDLNVNKCGANQTEYKEMLDILDVMEPPLIAGSPGFSFDPLTNNLAVGGPSSGGETERLDYVLLAKKFRQPINCWSEIIPLKATEDWQAPQTSEKAVGNYGKNVAEGVDNSSIKLMDLSDHYPVLAEFTFGDTDI